MADSRRDRRDTDSREQGRQRAGQNDEMPDLYSIFCGEVASVQAYGAFVKIPGYRKNGLVHKSQISLTRVEDVSEVLELGDRVYCKVISLGEDGDSKISLSMKFLNQGNGEDQDANLVQTKQEEQRRKKGGTFVQPKIELGAVFNTVCRKCGTKGHLARDCFKTPGGKSYDLLPDGEIVLPNAQQETKTSSAHKKKKKKKEKKKKSKKHRHRSASSDSSSSDSDTPVVKPHHKAPHIHHHTPRENSTRSHRSAGSDDTPYDRPHHKTPHTKTASRGQWRRSTDSGSSSGSDESSDRHGYKHSQKHHHNDREEQSGKHRSSLGVITHSDTPLDKHSHKHPHTSRDDSENTRKDKTQDRKRRSNLSPDHDTSDDKYRHTHPKKDRRTEYSSVRDSQRTDQRALPRTDSRSDARDDKHYSNYRRDKEISSKHR